MAGPRPHVLGPGHPISGDRGPERQVARQGLNHLVNVKQSYPSFQLFPDVGVSGYSILAQLTRKTQMTKGKKRKKKWKCSFRNLS